ncbi:divalent metal cation transporter [Rhodoblastus acidophilus]|uniref:Divalent metal cation transporter n=1 Tax=Candidatus Rhodoblastus alkanivorans TaxID=2954117 RepID=A0ABS9Z5W2_9HYPH|nr:divalent metal cation transporter [Candidatus Rhodoblastus alkanivorans]MCI4678655.1 divalent metal cation transporter [Candidatus Rhodoblastus alkanivorans]MCI4683064.1 divalent metal cation transporter [Candidatus Rhodoblastus alkanivorans]MDI4640375.1 divalent metal cation transporter [Rhodoblastus acidophilus]
MDSQAGGAAARGHSFLHHLAAWGPGLLVMLADTDAGNVVTAAQAGAQWNFRLLPLIFALIPALYLVQELAARLGLFGRAGFGEMIRARFGKTAALLALAGLALAAFGTLVTEFTGVAGVGELYGVSRDISLPATAFALLAVAATGSYRKVEQAALSVGLFEFAFLVVAWKARPHPLAVVRDFFHAPLTDRSFLFLAAAIVGSVFNPWMVFYQQAATARRKIDPEEFSVVRADTAAGAVLTQALTGAVLIAAAAALYTGDKGHSLDSIGQVGEALTAALGRDSGMLVYSLGVLGASFAAAIVASLALSWGVAEVFSARRIDAGAEGAGLFDSRRYMALYVVSVGAAAALVGFSHDLVWLNIATQVGNALLFPLIVGLLIALAAKALAPPLRLRGLRLAVMIFLAASVAVIGVIGAAAAVS